MEVYLFGSLNRSIPTEECFGLCYLKSSVIVIVERFLVGMTFVDSITYY